MMKGGHRTGRMADHTCCHGDTWYTILEEDEMKKTLGSSRTGNVISLEMMLITSSSAASVRHKESCFFFFFWTRSVDIFC